MFFSADHHFGHRNIIDHCARPFHDVRSMDEAMVSRWNQAVGPRDDVWHLGDLSYGDAGAVEAVFRRLNGRKRLVVGNHDRAATLRLQWAEPPVQIAMLKSDGRRLVLCHYGLRVWPGIRRGAIQLYGHSHGRLPGDSQSLDVGVDCWEFAPVSIDGVLARLATLPPRRDTEVF